MNILSTSQTSSHWYFPEGLPHHTVPKKDGSGMRPTTLRDARKMNLLPSVSGILKVLDKPGLNRWKNEQLALTVATAPRLDGEDVDAFIERVLNTERQQDIEGQQAADLGTQIHKRIEKMLSAISSGEQIFLQTEVDTYAHAAVDAIIRLGRVMLTETVVVGDGYAGCVDAIIENDDCITVIDIKTTKSIPKDESFLEHKLQLGAYAAALGNTSHKRITTANVYVSTIESGVVKVIENPDWVQAYELGFRPLVKHWQWANNYYPTQ